MISHGKACIFISDSSKEKLKSYFEAHVINILTDHLLKKAMNKLEAVG